MMNRDRDLDPPPDGGSEAEIAAGVAGWLRADDAVPATAVEAAKGGFKWRATGDELAELTYDSSDDLLGLTSVRGASTRQMCFAAGSASVEIELRDNARLLVGQVIPTGPAEVELVAFAEPGPARRQRADEVGRFVVEDLPAGPVRLRWIEGSGRRVATDWFRA
jgi:hypothetical protein